MDFLFTIFYQPIANLLFWLMELIQTQNIVLGILALVIVVKIALLYFSIKNTKFQIKMKTIADDLKNIRKTVKDKKEQAEKTLDLYKKAGINPFTPILLLLIQIPIFISIFFIVKNIGEGEFSYTETLYSSVQQIVPDFQLSLINITETGGIIAAVLVGVTQFALMYYSFKNIAMATTSKTQKIIFIVIFPILAGLVSYFFVMAVAVYWFFNNIVSIIQEVLILNTIRMQEDTSG